MNTLSKFNVVYYFSLVIGLVSLAACSSVPNVADMPSAPAKVETFRIGQADGLRIDVWRRPELSEAVVVRPDGMISMPLIGDVLASGKTTNELAEEVSNLLSDYVKAPQVTVIVTSPVSADYLTRVRVTGAVNNQISVPFREGMNVLDVVLEAGGPSEFASLNRARLYRKGEDGVSSTYTIKLGDILKKGKLETNYLLQPSDVITVPEKVF